jgi:hypothetical protein
MAATLTEQALKVLGSLEAKPALLFELLRIVQDEYLIVGPWVAIESPKIPGDYYYERRTPDGQSVAQVARNPKDHADWMWQVQGGNSGSTITGAPGAQVLADGDLTDLGWMLA